MTDLERMMNEIGFYDIVREESKRTIICEPHRVHQIRALVDQLDAADIITVKASPACPEGQLLILDEGAMAAEQEEFLQGLSRGPWRFGDTRPSP